MAYNANVPQATDQLSASQADILANFAALAPIVTSYNNSLLFNEQGADVATGATQMALYTKNVAGSPQMFLRRQSSPTAINFTSYTGATTGTMTLPNGIIVKWGQANVTDATTVNFSSAFPTTCWFVQVSSIRTAAQTNVVYTIPGSYTAAHFQAGSRTVGGTINYQTSAISYLAIGI
jgi:hypothetical protein